MSPSFITAVASFSGIGLALILEWLSRRERRLLELPPVSQRIQLLRGVLVFAVTLLTFLMFRTASLEWHCLKTDEVQPSPSGQTWRLAYHLTLLGLLILATAIDFDCYVIPDAITIPGTLIGILGAYLICEAQICHLWVDWSYHRPQLSGPLIPKWYDQHRDWHGLAWSLSGMVTGALLTYVARDVSSRVIGHEAMGLGDVTLMAMIGSFIGWQAITLTFLIAPLTGLTIGVILRMVTGKTYLPYGPWLSFAAVIVLFNWSTLWAKTRLIFSDWVSVATLALIGGGGFVVLLFLLQLYKSIPTRSPAKSAVSK